MSALPACMMPDGGDPCEAYTRLYQSHQQLRAAAKGFVDHYPAGINPYLDEACAKVREALKEKP